MTVATRPEPGPAREYHFPTFVRDRLENGLNIIVANVPKLPIVSVVMVIDATAISDEKGKEGVAELTAKALREGTTSRDGTALALDLEKLGTSLEAGADWDSTVASMTVLKNRLPEAFEILAEVITSPAFNEDDIDAFYRNSYVPQAMTLIMAGDITPEAGIELATQAFGEWKAERAATPVN